jgi:hypothetical protein
MQHVQDYSVITIGYQEWNQLVRLDGKLTILEDAPPKLSGVMQDATVVAIAASGVVNFDFVIALTELLPGRLEAKVETVYVSLIGAEASDPRITCVLEHSGESSARRRDGATVQITAAPRRAPISAAKA